MTKQIYILIGLPGCGKSTWSSNFKSETPNTLIVSSDAIRGELYGDENEQGNPELVFRTVFDRVIDGIRRNDVSNIIVDATNIKVRDRNNVIGTIKKRAWNELKGNADFSFTAVWFAVPIEECKRRNRLRERVVPDEVIERMYKNFCPPSFMEGYDRIEIVMSDYDKDKYSLENFLNVADIFDQHNPHHTLTLGGHCRKTQEYVDLKGCSKAMSFAALIHDNGKIFTASFINGKGEETEVMHFYQHHCTGAYDSAFYAKTQGFSNEDILYIANLIYYHMHPLLQWKNEKTMERAKLSLPEDFFNDIMLLHEGDVQAH